MAVVAGTVLAGRIAFTERIVATERIIASGCAAAFELVLAVGCVVVGVVISAVHKEDSAAMSYVVSSKTAPIIF